MGKKNQALAQPLKLGNLVVKNRIWQSPLWTRTAEVSGEAGERMIAHYAARAKGGCGLITQEAVAVDPNHTWIEPQARIDDDKFGPGLHRLVEKVHSYDAAIIAQLHNAGMFGRDPISPSGVACFSIGEGHYIQPRVLTVSEIEDIRDMFIKAAVRAKNIGYDGVELHGSTAYLLEQFFSPHNNRRVDKYGGDVYGRMRLALEILVGIRKACGPDFVVGYSGVDSDLVEGGINREDNLKLAHALENEGLTFFDLQNSGTYETFHLPQAPGGPRQKHGEFDMVAIYKKELHIPVTCRATRETNPDVWDEAIMSGKVDAVRAGRSMLADPDFAQKALTGHQEDIRCCIQCGNCKLSGVMNPWNMSCTVNPGMGDGEPRIEKASEKKNIVVVGAGPAGLEAARVSALRGHSVTLFEKNDHVGGNEYVGSLPVGKEELNQYPKWGDRQCRQLNVDIHLGTEADERLILEKKPDAVIIATGSRPARPGIPGIDKEMVVTAEDVLLGKTKAADRIAVLGGGEVGLETADYILEKGLAKQVAIIEMKDDVGIDMNGMDKGMLMGFVFSPFIQEGKLQIMTRTSVLEILDGSVKTVGGRGEIKEIPADQIVLALGYRSEKSLGQKLEEKGVPCTFVGDAVRPKRIWEAIHQANMVAREL
ncbi:MAG: NAD(P)/FAD-dependent oxidoreductase [Lachnospiraceae bacterium]|nr:NAD(P)/FAD-dependent oxidoreductase [Lachnospiraceae bacterium]